MPDLPLSLKGPGIARVIVSVLVLVLGPMSQPPHRNSDTRRVGLTQKSDLELLQNIKSIGSISSLESRGRKDKSKFHVARDELQHQECLKLSTANGSICLSQDVPADP